MEAVWKIEVEDFPAFIVVDDKGNDFFTDPSGAVTVPISGIRVRSRESGHSADAPWAASSAVSTRATTALVSVRSAACSCTEV